MPINASYEYLNAEKKYFEAQTLDEKIIATEEMIKTAPKHKGSENLLSELKTRLKKFKEKQEKNKKARGGKKGIRKEGYQFVLIGPPNSGKSSLLAQITNAKPNIEVYPFTTKEPEIGTFYFEGVKAQIVDLPSIGSESFDIGIANTADAIIIVIEKLEDFDKIIPLLSKAQNKKLIVIAKSDLYTEEMLRKLNANLNSKKINGIVISNITTYGIKELKEKMVKEMEVIRVYMKEPGKQPSPIPVVLPKGSTVKNVAESIRKGFSEKIKEIRLTGPSSKFPNQKAGLTHILKDKDIVEFHTT